MARVTNNKNNNNYYCKIKQFNINQCDQKKNYQQQKLI